MDLIKRLKAYFTPQNTLRDNGFEFWLEEVETPVAPTYAEPTTSPVRPCRCGDHPQHGVVDQPKHWY